MSSEISGTLVRKCKFPGCKNGFYRKVKDPLFKNKHFHRFPRNPDFAAKWKVICGLPNTAKCENFRICGDHFVESDFLNLGRQRLVWNAMPLDASEISNLMSKTPGNEVESAVMNEDESLAMNEGSVSMNEEMQIEFAPFTSQVLHENEIICDDDPLDNSRFYQEFDSKDVYSYEDSENERESDIPFDFEFLLEEDADCADATNGHGKRLGVNGRKLTDWEIEMYQIHRNTSTKLSKLKKKLTDESRYVADLKDLYESQMFENINDSLIKVPKKFIEFQYRDVIRTPPERPWTVEDKTFALSIYKRSPRLYRYLSYYFTLPSSKLLKQVLYKIPFEPGLNEQLIQTLKTSIESMNPLDRCCSLIFDEMSLHSAIHETNTDRDGYSDVGSEKCSGQPVNALVLMLRGIRKNWKQVVAYYFSQNSVSSEDICDILQSVISHLQNEGFNIMATVCDQNPTNRKALALMSMQSSRSDYFFTVDSRIIYIIFDVPHLLKDTRNALLKNKLIFGKNREVHFAHISEAFQLDQRQPLPIMYRLKPADFNFDDPYMKMKVKTAAKHLSRSTALALQTLVCLKKLPCAALHTFTFVQKMDKLFDSLNSSNVEAADGKELKCAVSRDSPHMEFWESMLAELDEWQFIDLQSHNNVTNKYQFIHGWKVTIRSVIALWNSVKEMGFRCLPVRSLNQDPIENLFCNIRQHGISTNNPTCRQFTAAIKTVVLNNLEFSDSKYVDRNCEDDDCTVLSNLQNFVTSDDCDSELVVDVIAQ